MCQKQIKFLPNHLLVSSNFVQIKQCIFLIFYIGCPRKTVHKYIFWRKPGILRKMKLFTWNGSSGNHDQETQGHQLCPHGHGHVRHVRQVHDPHGHVTGVEVLETWLLDIKILKIFNDEFYSFNTPTKTKITCIKHSYKFRMQYMKKAKMC